MDRLIMTFGRLPPVGGPTATETARVKDPDNRLLWR